MKLNRLVRIAYSVTLSVVIYIAGVASVPAADEIASKYIRQTAGADTIIVFVHGFMGDALTTWTSSNNTYWPVLLTKDHTFDGSDIFVYAYPTGLSATLSIDELAEDMRRTLSAKGVATYEKVVFLSHSMGGLVTRAYLLKNRDVAAHTSFAYFFSTPTTGSQFASILNFITNSPQISKLKSMKPDEYLADLLRQWLAARFNFPSYCAYEKRQTRGLALVVTMESAASLCTRALDPIDTDHIDIVKPDSQDASAYLAFKAAYAEAKIPDLKYKLDNKASTKLASEIAELARFPNGPDSPAPHTMLETLLRNKLPHRMFGILARYDRSKILGVPHGGEALYQFKTIYYDFQSKATEWEENVISKIGQTVAVRFRQGWVIYLRYFVLRIFGNSKEQVTAQGDFLNYDITWDDAERVFTEVSGDPLVAKQTSALVDAVTTIGQQAQKIASAK
jgi:pimeloyl-ACP methyl ester carboxylesterase